MARPRPAPRLLLSLLVLVAAAVANYRSLYGGLVFDDGMAVMRNRDVLNPLSSELWWNDFWGYPVASDRSHKSYRPLTVISYRLNYLLNTELLGVAGLDPSSFHVVNFVLHLLVCVAFPNVLMMVPPRCGWTRALVAGLVFAVHPVHVEASASVVGRAEMLSALAFLATVAMFVAWPRRPLLRALATLVGAGVATLFKEQGITVMGVCLLIDLAPTVCGPFFAGLARAIVAQWRPIVALCAGTVVLLGARFSISGTGARHIDASMNPAAFHEDFWTRVRTYCYLHARHMLLLFWPNPLCCDYSGHTLALVSSWSDPRNIAGPLAYGVVIGALVLWAVSLPHTPDTDARRNLGHQSQCAALGEGGAAKRDQESTSNGLACATTTSTMAATADANAKHGNAKHGNAKHGNATHGNATHGFVVERRHRATGVLVGVAWMCLCFLPAANVLMPVGFVIAERVLYLPSMGFCLAVAWVVVPLPNTPAEADSGSAGAGQEGCGDDDCRNDGAECHRGDGSDGSESHEEGVTPYSGGERNSALACDKYCRAFVFAVTCSIFGYISWTRTADWHTDRALYSSAARAYPTNAKMIYNLGILEAIDGERDAAERLFRETLRLRPTHVQAHSALAYELVSKGDVQYYAEAERLYFAGLHLDVRGEWAGNTRFNLGTLVETMGRLEEADGHFQAALYHDPLHWGAIKKASQGYESRGDLARAEQLLRRCADRGSHRCSWRGGRALPPFDFALFLMRQSRLDEAREVLQAALGLHLVHPDRHTSAAAAVAGASWHNCIDLETCPVGDTVRSEAAEQEQGQEIKQVDAGNNVNDVGHVSNLAHAIAELQHADSRQLQVFQAWAHRIFMRALNLDPLHANTHRNLGTLHLRRGQLREAACHYRSALQFDNRTSQQR